MTPSITVQRWQRTVCLPGTMNDKLWTKWEDNYLKALKNNQKQAKAGRNAILERREAHIRDEMHIDLAFPPWELLTSCGTQGEIELNRKAAVLVKRGNLCHISGLPLWLNTEREIQEKMSHRGRRPSIITASSLKFLLHLQTVQAQGEALRKSNIWKVNCWAEI